MDREKKKTDEQQQQFQFCEVCKLNHNQGRRHIYFPNHKTSFRLLLTRFQSKLSGVRFFLRSPTPFRPEYAHTGRLWCVICDYDVIELGSPFAWESSSYGPFCNRSVFGLIHLCFIRKVRLPQEYQWPLGTASLRISHIPHEGTEGSVHTGAPPPWFDESQGNQLDSTRRPELSNLISPKAGKSSRLNPKRVGAAWAERRNLELELEKIGEPLTNTSSANWLPNFGRVWQSGTRKDSRKEFQMENKLSCKEDVQSENRMPLQPYISKKMRRDTSE